MATSFYSSKTGSEIVPAAGNGDQERANPIIAHGHSHGHGVTLTTKDDSDSQLLGYREMVLELGTIVHSVVIALYLGATNDTCTIKGIGLGGCILQAVYTTVKKLVIAFFAVTTPFGIVLGIALSSIYRDNSPAALITVGLFNACSAGLLIYMALVNLLAAELMGPKLQGSIKLQIKCFFAALLGCGGMSILAKRA
ncbi:fe(2+) transport protein 1-like [Brassica rapa]|uniref:fe(2+) transport protein 1-like n=1 Tax=Brassica campestris TaxID=3711 RepID=UPI00142DEE81|nr:fe(2+) transport protein 1-like [Brassica rapa]